MMLFVGFLLVVLGDDPLPKGEWGHLKGRIVLDTVELPKPRIIKVGGKQVPDEWRLINPVTFGIKDFVVTLKQRPKQIHPDGIAPREKAHELTIKDHRFSQQISLAREGQILRIRNQEPYAVYAMCLSRNPGGFSCVINSREFFDWPLKAAGNTWPDHIQSTNEEVGGRIESLIHVTDHPYAAITNEKGEFSIQNLPVGKHEFRLWHRHARYFDGDYRFEVRRGETNVIHDITLEPDQLGFKQ